MPIFINEVRSRVNVSSRHIVHSIIPCSFSEKSATEVCKLNDILLFLLCESPNRLFKIWFMLRHFVNHLVYSHILSWLTTVRINYAMSLSCGDALLTEHAHREI